MKKFRMYNVKFTIILLVAAVFVMFAAPATASAAPSATISAWQWNGKPGQNLTFTASANAPGASTTGVRIYRTPASSQSWTLMNNTICNGSTCNLNASWTATTGDWYIVVNAYANPATADYFTGNPATECTGSPWGYNSAQWSGCGSKGNLWIRVSNPPSPTVNSGPTCTSGDTSNMYTVSWAGSSPAITYLDVSTSSNFSTYFNKAVTGTSTPLSSGITGYWNGSSWSGGSLTLWPNTTYYTRLWDGFNHSNTASFTTPGTCTPPAAQITSPANNTTILVNQTVTISAAAQIQRGSLTRGELWASPIGGEAWQSPAITKVNWTGSSPQSLSGTWTPTTIGSYYIAVNAFDDTNGSKCTGNPFRLPGGWSTCGSGGSIRINVIPNCNTGISCSGSCSASANTCSANNGTKSSCVYTTYSGGGTCNQVSAPNQACTINNCSSGYTCSSGTCTPPPPPTANLNAPANNSSNIIGQSMTVSATAAGTNLKKINIYRAPKGSNNWTRIAENDTCGGESICGVSSSWTPTTSEVGQWDISVNAFDNYGQQCSGMQSSSGYWTAWCGRNGSTSNVMVNVVPPPPPAPSVSANPICTPTDTSGMYTISWSNISPQITYVDISDNNFAVADWWNKYVAGSTSTSASTGFGGPKGSLVLQPNKTYYVRLWNGSHSSTATFTTPVSCTCTGNNIIDNPADPLPATYVVGTNYNMNGWGTFCSGPNGTNRNRVDIHVCNRGTWNCRQLGSATSYPRQDVVNTATSPTWTCGNLNSNPDGWTFSWTPDSSFLGNKDLFVASINDPGTTCYIGTSKPVNITLPPPPTANLNAPANNSSNIIGQSMTVSATAAGTNLKKINIYRAPKGSNNWTRIAENDTCGGESICGVSSSWTPTTSEVGQWDISVNAFDNYGQQCSGMQSSSGYWTAWCGRNGSTSNVMVNVVFPPPTAQVTSPINNGSFYVNLNIPVEAAAQIPSPGSLTKGELWVTNATDPNNPILPVGCPGTTSGYWCLIIDKPLSGTSAAFSGNWTPRAVGTYRIAVNAFDDVNKTKCTGNPFTAIPAGWSSCGSYRWTQISVIPPPPPPTANISAPDNDNYTIIDNAMTVSATANGTNLTRMDIYRAPKDSNSWTKIAEKTCSGSSCSLSSSWTPTAAEAGQWKIAVNAFDSYDQRCSGMQVTQPNYWTAWCGRNSSTSNITVNVILPPPQATISGPKTAIANDSPPSYTAILSGGTQSGQIWVTKEDGLFTFPCTTQMIQASTTRRYWCLAGQGTEQFITGSYNFQEQGNYTVVVNAFNRADLQGSSQADRCTGTPDNLAKDSAGNDVTWSSWSKCDPDDPKNNNSRAYIPVAVSEPLTTTNCGGGINPRAEGLVTTPSLTGKFGTSPEGRCIKDDPKTIFTTFKIPTYNDLKSIYYTQAKSSSTTIKEPPQASGPINLTGKDHIYNITGDLTISSPSDIAGTKTGIIFVEGNLKIGPISGNKLNYGNNNSGLVFVVRGNVNIESSVTQVDAIIMSEGNICTAANGTVCLNGTTVTPQLTIDGSLIALDPTKPIQFRRNLNRNDCPSCAAEIINNRPKYLVILSNLFASTLQKWSDVTAGGSVVPTNCKAFNGNANACYNKGCSYNYLSQECQ